MSEQASAIFSSTKESSVLATEPLMMRNVDARKDERGFLCGGDESLEEVMKRAPFSPGKQKAPDSTLASKLASVDSNYVLTWLAPPGTAVGEPKEEDDGLNMYQSRPMSPSESSSSPRYAASPPNAGDEASCPHHQYGAGDENPRHPFFHRDHLDHLDQHSHAKHQEIYHRHDDSHHHHHHHYSSAQSSQTVSTEDVGSLCSSPRQTSTETSSEPSRDRLAFSPPETRRTLQRSTNHAGGTNGGGSRPVITLSNGALKASSGSSPFREGCSCKPYKYTRAQSAGQGLTPALDDENSPVRQKLTFV